MTKNKEIIINGVDVSGCEHFENADQEMCCGLTCCGGCRGINCYYKQLKRLEQELKVEKQDKKYIKECCIRAGKELSKHSFEWDGKEKNLVVQAMQLNEDYERLEQENEELKKQYNDIYDYLQEREKLINGTIQDIYKANKENEKLKQALEEIRGIVEKEYNKSLDEKDCIYCDSSFRLIQDKINEVLK